MKIYYELADTQPEELKLQSLFFFKWKYKILWTLKKFDAEIQKDTNDGRILVPTLGNEFIISVAGFSDELREKIASCLNALWR